jgi:hypothetical protein
MKYGWIKDIPHYLNYFNPDQKLMIESVGIDNFLLLYDHFKKTALYFPKPRNQSAPPNNRQLEIIDLIGKDDYENLLKKMRNSDIYIGSVGMMELKKAWAKLNRHKNPDDVARDIEVSSRSVRRWRRERCSFK